MWPSPFFVLPLLSAETELLDNCPVSLDVFALEIIKSRTTFAYELEKCAACAVVLLVCLEVLCKVSDTVGK